MTTSVGFFPFSILRVLGLPSTLENIGFAVVLGFQDQTRQDEEIVVPQTKALCISEFVKQNYVKLHDLIYFRFGQPLQSITLSKLELSFHVVFFVLFYFVLCFLCRDIN